MNDRLPFLREKTAKLTTNPGVYIMKNSQEKIIYIGKAKNLKNRVTGYFRENPDHTPKAAKMVSQVYDYDFIVTDSEYEALVLECSLIKQHKPKYNILLKDDKGYHYIKISGGDYPRITAEKQLYDDGGTYLGPYTSSFVTKQAVAEANRCFMLPICTRRFPQEFGRQRPCLNHHIRLCMGVCTGKIPAEEYRDAVNQAIHYIKTGSSDSVERMRLEMEQAAENLDFERAARLRDRVAAVSKAADTQKIINNDLADTDVIGLAENGGTICVSVLMYRGGRLSDKAAYILGKCEADELPLEAFLMQFYHGRSDVPRVILIEEDIPSRTLLEQLFREKSGHAVHITVRVKGQGRKLIMLAKSNAGEYLSLRVGRTGKEILALEELAKVLGLPEPPMYIEAYDISNLQSDAMVAGMVVFENGRPKKSDYRKFSIKTLNIQNDYASMAEVIERRFTRYLEGDEKFSHLPQLIFVDGGKGQVGAVLPILEKLGINVPVFGIVKDSRHRTRAISTHGGEISVSGASFAMITKIQDEMHRFAITYQRVKHAKRSFASELTSVKGIGDKKAQKILTHFKTKQALKSTSAEELMKIAGISAQTAEDLMKIISEIR